jgi:hypothetical protein
MVGVVIFIHTSISTYLYESIHKYVRTSSEYTHMHEYVGIFTVSIEDTCLHAYFIYTYICICISVCRNVCICVYVYERKR